MKKIVIPAMRHRVRIRPENEMDGVTPEAVINSVLDEVKVPK